MVENSIHNSNQIFERIRLNLKSFNIVAPEGSTWVTDIVEWCARTERAICERWLIRSTYRQAAPFLHCKYSTLRYNPQFSSRTKPYNALSISRPRLLCWHSICFRYPPSTIVTLFGNYVKYNGLLPKYSVLSVKAHFTYRVKCAPILSAFR